MTELAVRAQQGGPQQSGATGQTTAGGSRKLDPSEAGFAKGTGIANLRCGDCTFYQNGACQIVDVKAEPDDYCDQFEPGTQTGRMAASEAINARSLPVVDLYITRVTRDPATGVRRWRATSSGVKRDLYGEKMSVALYRDFIRRIDENEPVPEPFSSRAWSGGLPYLGVAHYLDLEGFGIVGPTDKMWVDGDTLKARGRFNEGPLSDGVFKSIQEDARQARPDNERVRISIAFLDWGHRHGDGPVFERASLVHRCEDCERGSGEKMYVKGQLIHLATTRRPAYPETEIVALEERSMSTIRDDAASIVGEELADELEKRANTLKTRSSGDVAPGVVVIREEGQATDDGSGKPFDGAVTLDEAEAFLQKSGQVLLDDWSVLAGVLSNIATRSEGDKGKAIRAAIHEFQNTLDVQTAKALLRVERIVGGKPMTQAVTREQANEDEERRKREKEEAEAPEEPLAEAETEGEGEDEEKEKKKVPVAASLAVKAHPLDPLFATFRGNYDDVMSSPGTAQEKLQALQAPFNEFGTALQQSIHVAVPASTEEVVARAIAEALPKALQPYLAKIAELEASRGNAAVPPPPIPPSVPVRRAVRGGPMPLNSPIVHRSDPTPQRVSATPGLQRTIRKTVFTS